MKILFFSPDHTNSTDGVIVAGTRKLLRLIFGHYDFDYCDIDRPRPLLEEEHKGFNRYDLIVVIGTPWLWEGFEKSIKWNNLKQLLSEHKGTKVIFLGIGSCYFHNFYLTKLKNQAIEEIKEVYKDALIIVRDSLAQRKFKQAGLDVPLLLCPSYFAYHGRLHRYFPRDKNILVWYDPTVGLSQSGWQDKEILERYFDVNLEFYNKYEPEVYTHLTKEIPLAIKIGLPQPKLIGGWENTLTIMSTADRVLSGRVHCAVPALVSGCVTGLFYIDSRSKTVSDFGGTIVKGIEDLDKMKKINLDLTTYAIEYFRIIRNYIENK